MYLFGSFLKIIIEIGMEITHYMNDNDILRDNCPIHVNIYEFLLVYVKASFYNLVSIYE